MANTGWVEAANATNDVATATHAAHAQRQHIVDAVDASFSDSTKSAVLQIKDGTTVIWQGKVHGSFSQQFPSGISITPAAACSAVLAAGGSAIVGYVNLHGHSL